MASGSIKTPDLSHLKAVYTNIADSGGTYTLVRPSNFSPTLLILGRTSGTTVSIKGLYFIDAWRGLTKIIGDDVLDVTMPSDSTSSNVTITNRAGNYATLLAIMYNP